MKIKIHEMICGIATVINDFFLPILSDALNNMNRFMKWIKWNELGKHLIYPSYQKCSCVRSEFQSVNVENKEILPVLHRVQSKSDCIDRYVGW